VENEGVKVEWKIREYR